jgi:glycerophosphoryl diester phosphodiesterase
VKRLPFRLYGHRGASAERPENTLASFARALEAGADALETDVHLTADGHVVVSHDASGARAAGVARRIAASTLDEVQRWDAGWGFVAPGGGRTFAGRGLRIPTLREVLERFPGVHVNVDVKQRAPSMVAPLLSLLREARAEERVTLASFDAAVLAALRRAGYRGETALGRSEVLRLLVLPLSLLKLRPLALAGHAVQIPPRTRRFDLSAASFIAKCHALGLRVDYWTVNDPAEAEALVARGADGIMSDDPAAVAPVVARARG